MFKKDSFLAEKAILLCNGPSLAKVELSRLDRNRFFLVGLNNIVRFLDQLSISIDFYIAADRLIFQDSRDVIHKLSCWKYLREHTCDDDLKVSCRVTTFNSDCQLQERNLFSFDPNLFVSGLAGAPYIAFQILHYLGFQEICIIGMDHTLGMPNHPDSSKHFVSNYFSNSILDSDAVEKTKPMSERDPYFNYANEVFKYSRRQIFNCTPNSLCKVFPHAPLDYLYSAA
ncbi:hypothetical protein [Synechococcus sp. N19]|uniref:hypothetical protein n=1 Tax=Synechococcus sp. N19 TaxID=2575512 RepID=UPI0010BE5020|nr:hypothetical protein [Synechococcus sp. N19]